MDRNRRVPFHDIGNTVRATQQGSRKDSKGKPAAPHAVAGGAGGVAGAAPPCAPAAAYEPTAVCSETPAAAASSSVAPYSPGVDAPRAGDHLQVAQYTREIMQHLRNTESNFRPSANYMGRQTDINEKMRSILVDWLVDVHLKFKLLPETLHLAVILIDRFLASKVVTRQRLQLVGVVAMLIGAKYEEIYPPEIKDFIYISANTYTKDEILRMELLMLQTLEFNLTVPTIYPFVQRALQVFEADQVCRHMTYYFAELSLLDYNLLVFWPSTIAAACIYLARKVLISRAHMQGETWTDVLEHYTTYTWANPSFSRCVHALYDLVRGAKVHKCQAIRKKYSYAKNSGVSELADMEFSLPLLP
uniref:Cyclin N-terminal domain-containing protein n=1 Tax=Eutreptiella gymnastica TaxID=73025 RepID=A0A7S1NPT6_9EUGL|mmetsp:Transcript_68859/g.121627  ORF Transcript_68859/g.121627 Transcript_68859/m.121627 type:complete len:360 (+) Transcript_68859:110-1189(+)